MSNNEKNTMRFCSSPDISSSLRELCAGIPLDPMPPLLPRDPRVPRAPVRTPKLNPKEKQVSLISF